MIKRDTLIPPPVLPAQAPTNIRNTSIILEVSGHTSKSAVLNPVVVIIEPTWKAALVSASKALSYNFSILIKINNIENRND